MKVNTWTKARKSNPIGSCAEVQYRTAEKSWTGNNCVEVGFSTAEKSGAAGHCVQVGFAKAQKSNGGSEMCVEVSFDKADDCSSMTDCVEVSTNDGSAPVTASKCNCETVVIDGVPTSEVSPDTVLVRDTKDRDVPAEQRTVLAYTPTQWMALLSKVKQAGMNWTLRDAVGNYLLMGQTTKGHSSVLTYTEAEWDAFLDGALKGEFDKELPAAGKLTPINA